MTPILVNAVSLFPLIIGPWGPRYARWFAERLGFDGIQSLPLRGWNAKTIRVLPADFVQALEMSPWNYGSLRQVVRRYMMKLLKVPIKPDHEPPLFHDWLLFESTLRANLQSFLDQRKRFPNALLIKHSLESNLGALELNPEVLHLIGKTANDVITMGVPLVLDFVHLTRSDRYGNGIVVTTNTTRFLYQLHDSAIAAIHVHPPSLDILRGWLGYDNTEFGKFVDAAVIISRRSRRQIPFIVELPPMAFELLPHVRKKLAAMLF